MKATDEPSFAIASGHLLRGVRVEALADAVELCPDLFAHPAIVDGDRLERLRHVVDGCRRIPTMAIELEPQHDSNRSDWKRWRPLGLC